MNDDWDSKKYKHFHELFMQNLKGTSFTETFMAVTPLFFSVFLSTLFSLIHTSSQGLNFYNFCIDFFLIVFLPILCFTVLSNSIPLVVIVLCTFSLITLFYFINCHRNIYVNCGMTDVWSSHITELRKPFITNFRALTNVLSAICILAVDFRVFPRRFAKTETFGYGLMDTGVGLYCIANSIVSPEVLHHEMKTFHSLLQSFQKSLKSCIPLLILGVMRFFTIKQIDYQVHISEYGVHWNFFLTLAVAKLLSSLVMSLCDIKYSFLLSVIIIGIHECILQCGMQDWVLSDAARDSFLSANREGIFSSLGYIALYLSGVSLGYMLRSTAMTFREKFMTNLKLTGLSVLLWTCVSVSQNCLRISRRLANAGYFLWILTFSITALAIFLIMELVTRVLYIKRKDAPANQVYVPVLLEAVNYNGLGFFLLANLCTGLVNLYIKTLFIGPALSVFIVAVYMLVVCLCTFILYRIGCKLKL
ncbi:uncharacterized protein [Anabrus simplex]|uniref:uncharacterized protein n=1 Tax=Anabrus simplex TaxID=316456 RepID=UPI0035A2A27F